MAYLKRQSVPKTWPVTRKGTAYLVRPKSSINNGVPLLVILREVLGVVQNRNEAKKILLTKQILLNGKEARDERETAQLFDVITIIPSNKNYKTIISKNKKFDFVEIPNNEAGCKVAKIVNKKTLKGKKTQLNLSDGRNFLSDIKCNTGDSIIIDFAGKKIDKCLPMEKGRNVFVFSGKHAGQVGVLEEVDKEKKTAQVKADKEIIHVLTKQVIVTK